MIDHLVENIDQIVAINTEYKDAVIISQKEIELDFNKRLTNLK